MFGRLDLLRSDAPKQIDRASHPEITPVTRNDEIVAWATRSASGHQPADLIEAGSCVNLHRRPIHHARYGLAVVDFRMQRPAQKDEQVIAVNHPDRAFVLEHSQRCPGGFIPETFYDLGNLHRRVYAWNLEHEVSGVDRIGRSGSCERRRD